MKKYKCYPSPATIATLLPPGRVFKKAFEEGSNFYKIMEFIMDCYERRCDLINEYHDGFFIQDSDRFIREWQEDLKLPNTSLQNVFGFEIENPRVVFILKNLTGDNTVKGLQAIWNALGARVKVSSDSGHTIVIERYTKLGDRFAYDFAVTFEKGITLNKLKYITEQVIPIHTTVIYREIDEFVVEPIYTDVDEPKFNQFTIAGQAVQPIITVNEEEEE